MAKDNIFRFVLSKEDKEALMKVAEWERISASALLRQKVAALIKGHPALDKN